MSRLGPEAARRAGTLAVLACSLAFLPLFSARIGAPDAIALLPADQRDAVACRLDPGAALILGRPIPVDRARAPDWALLPGIGPKRAAAIVAARPESVEALSQVKGLGPKRIAAIRALVTDPSPTPARPCR